MKERKAPKKHHYLPQFYLERFKIIPQKGKVPHIYRVEKSALPKVTLPAIKDTGCKTDYHTVDFDNQNKDRQTVEHALSQIEADQARLVDSICKNNKIAENQKKPLASFITTMRCRVLVFKCFIESLLEKVVGSSFEILMRNGKIPKPPKEIEDVIQREGYKPNIYNWMILWWMFQMAFKDENVSLLEKMKHQLIIAPNGHYFITGDSPVALYHPNYDSIKPYGVGPALKGTEVTFPISKNLLVKLTWDGEEGVTTAQEDEIWEYNRRSIVMADSQIFASEVSSDLLKKIALFHTIKAGYTLDVLPHKNGVSHISRFIPVTK